jgi:hypothetical protein
MEPIDEKGLSCLEWRAASFSQRDEVGHGVR